MHDEKQAAPQDVVREEQGPSDPNQPAHDSGAEQASAPQSQSQPQGDGDSSEHDDGPRPIDVEGDR